MPDDQTLKNLRGIMDGITAKVEQPSGVALPVYNPKFHKAGAIVRIWQIDHWERMVVPETDLDGNPLEPGSSGRLIGKVNTNRPKFKPAPKPTKKKRVLAIVKEKINKS